jgi:gamma-glutamylcyclotransferase (GGCT)/AIG2-like uncharacterized protein YtfP
MPKVFVYGTLKTGLHNNRVIKQQLVESVVEAKLEGYALYYVSNGNFPLIVPDPNGVVYGELVTFKEKGFERQLEELDMLEGYSGRKNQNNLYNRIEVAVEVEGENKKTFTQTYEFNYQHLGHMIGDKIEDGNFTGAKVLPYRFR